MNTERFLKKLKADDFYREQIVFTHKIPARRAKWGKLDYPLPGRVTELLDNSGIKRLYSHQVEAVKAVREGKSIVIVTSTASGKTLCYNIPVIERFLEDRECKALYLYPTKALAQDQLRVLESYGRSIDFKAGTYDGDTPGSLRKKLRGEADILLTNPDMLHSGILPNHSKWARFFANLQFVVIDEIHTYRGIFGSHVANVIGRLERICGYYGAKPVYVTSSATIANPGEHAERLTGRRIKVIKNDGSPRGEKKFVMWNPPVIDEIGVDRRSTNVEAADIIAKLVMGNVQTIAFVKSRVVSEVITRYVRGILKSHSSSLDDSVHPYRGGYLPEERREIERLLFENELKAVISTNALELGIDVGALYASVIVGYPGSIASTWQQAGRAGRGEEESVVFFLVHNTPLEQYLVKHPEYFLGRTPENAIIDPENPYVLLGQLRAAAFELPLSGSEVSEMGQYAPAIAELLEEEREFNFLRGKWYWRGKGYPSASVNLRNISPDSYTIIDESDGNRVIGTVDEASAFQQVHPDAVYLHQAFTYFVNNLDIDKKVAFVSKCDLDYYTQSITETRVKIDKEEKKDKWKISEIGFGDVSVTDLTFMFRKIKFGSRDSIGYGKCDLPPQILETAGLWIMPPREVFAAVRKWGRVPSEGLLGLSNVLREVVPLFVMCDPLDIGTTVNSGSTAGQALYLYDKYPGGIGFSLKSYDLVEEIMSAALELIKACSCENGCPSCVGSPIPPFTQLDPDSGGRGMIPDKEAALVILHSMLQLQPYRPAAVKKERNVKEEKRPKVKPLPVELEGKLREGLYGRKKRNDR
ncbi:MAG: DEAD/DEAH box helicase [Candidatus Krumholzibacteriota bacterium]|nr:DEAD/DEAH box helicase [Candidatus Krumholzibacteriota bacterium]